MQADGLFELKRKWLPLLVLGAAIVGAGLTLGLLALYRESPRWVTDTVVDFLTPASPEPPPRGTLISLAAAAFVAVGGVLLAVAVSGIRRSEVGEINSFWWKVAVGALAGQWWLNEPRIVVLAAGPQLPRLLRALKTVSSRLTVLAGATPELALALAEDEAGVGPVVGLLGGALENHANGLRLRGQFAAPHDSLSLRDTVRRADIILCAPDLDGSDDFGLRLPDALAEASRLGRGKRVLVAAVSAPDAHRLRQAERWCAARFGSFHTTLANSNTVPALPPGRYYQTADGALARDLADWNTPGQWDVEKLAVFLREALGRR